MTQRNPMNERYTSEERKGSTRKSASSAKPVSKAASSVRVQSTTKTKEQKKAEQKAERQKQREMDAQYYNPPTEEYKKLRRLWWIFLVGAIVLTLISWLGRTFMPEVGIYITLGLAYVCIIAALYIDFSKIRKVRRAYQAEMATHKSKETRAAEKQYKAALREAEKEAAAKAAADEVETEEKKGFLSGLFGKKN